MGRLEQGHSMMVGMVEDMEEQEQLLEEEQALGRGMVVVVVGIPTRAAGFGQWREEELAEGEQAWLEPEDPCGGHGGGGCGWCGGSVEEVVVGVVVAYSNRLGRWEHTLEPCNCIHKGLRLSFLQRNKKREGHYSDDVMMICLSTSCITISPYSRQTRILSMYPILRSVIILP